MTQRYIEKAKEVLSRLFSDEDDKYFKSILYKDDVNTIAQALHEARIEGREEAAKIVSSAECYRIINGVEFPLTINHLKDRKAHHFLASAREDPSLKNIFRPDIVWNSSSRMSYSNFHSFINADHAAENGKS
jgi:hypothetical protein